MYNILNGAHSGLRWIALILLIIAIFNAAASSKSGKYAKKDKMLNLFTMVVLHIQLLIGLGLMFLSPKVQYVDEWMKSKMYRFYGLEHVLMMLLAIAIITIGRKRAESAAAINTRHRRILVSYTIGLLIILAMIPWPFREALGGKWF